MFIVHGRTLWHIVHVARFASVLTPDECVAKICAGVASVMPRAARCHEVPAQRFHSTTRWVCGGLAGLPRASEFTIRHDALAEALHLLGREGRAREVLAHVERAEEVHDVVHPLVEVRPVAR